MRTFFFFSLVLCVSCAHTTREIASSPPAFPQKIIDAHVHMESRGGRDVSEPSAEMLDELMANQVVGAIAHASRKAGPPSGVRSSFPTRFVVCAAVVPPRTVKEVENGIRKGTYGCLKIYLAYVPRYASDPYYKPFYQLAQKHDVPVVFHTGDPYDKMAKVKYADPLSIDEIAVSYPQVKFVLAHLGNPWIVSAAEVVYKNDNVYTDTSGVLLGDLSKTDPEAVQELFVKPLRWFYLYVENPQKILFGTDWPLAKVGPYIEAVKRAIPQKHWEDVFYRNACRVFRKLECA